MKKLDLNGDLGLVGIVVSDQKGQPNGVQYLHSQFLRLAALAIALPFRRMATNMCIYLEDIITSTQGIIVAGRDLTFKNHATADESQ